MWQIVYYSINSLIMPASIFSPDVEFYHPWSQIYSRVDPWAQIYSDIYMPPVPVSPPSAPDNAAGHQFRAGFTFAYSRYICTEEPLVQILPSLLYRFPWQTGMFDLPPCSAGRRSRVAHHGGPGPGCRTEGTASTAAPAAHPPVAQGQLDRSWLSCWGITHGKCCSLSHGSWAAAGRAAQGAVLGLAQTAGTGSCGCLQVTALISLLPVLHLTHQHRALWPFPFVFLTWIPAIVLFHHFHHCKAFMRNNFWE